MSGDVDPRAGRGGHVHAQHAGPAEVVALVYDEVSRHVDEREVAQVPAECGGRGPRPPVPPRAPRGGRGPGPATTFGDAGKPSGGVARPRAAISAPRRAMSFSSRPSR